MKNSDKLVTIIIGERSNLSYHLFKRLNHAEIFSSALLLQSLVQLSKFREKKVNVVFNNFQPSTHLNSFVDPCKYVDLSISLTLRVLMYLIESGAIINQIIYSSSCSVYGNVTRGDNYSEVSPIGVPSSLKYINEQILREVCNDYDLKLTIARIFNIFGGNDEFSVISKIYNCFINKTKLGVLNDGKSVRDYIHVNNIVDIYEKILLDSSIKLDTIDVGSGLGKSLAEILIYLSNNRFTFDTESSNKNEIDFSQANTSMIKKIIDISTFIDVNVYLLDKLKSSGDKNKIIR